ncbi:hypothetical protein BC332_33831 [Capsicum chinense]|nr:hypothetical protein BC332_33831 [Capsicum chinense]
MTKMGVRPSRIVDPRKRKVLLDKRLESLYKKAKHLEILCDIEIGMFFFTPGDQNIFAWPSLTQATDWVKNYIASFDKQRPIKMVKHEDFLQSVLNAKEGKINQLEKLVEKKEMEYNFNQLVEARKRFDELENLTAIVARHGGIALRPLSHRGEVDKSASEMLFDGKVGTVMCMENPCEAMRGALIDVREGTLKMRLDDEELALRLQHLWVQLASPLPVVGLTLPVPPDFSVEVYQ